MRWRKNGERFYKGEAVSFYDQIRRAGCDADPVF